MSVFYVSDLHLGSGAGPAAVRFVDFLRRKPVAGDVLLMGGDIFDLYLGDKRVFREKYANLLAAIALAAGRGVRVVFLEGNHDFHLEKVFRACGAETYPESFGLILQGRRIWLSHGDRIDPEDRGYHLLRFVTRSWPFRCLLHFLPGSWIEWIGGASSRTSRQYNRTDRLGPERKARLRELFLGYARERVSEGWQHVLVGHSHLRDQVSLGEGGEYVNLGFVADHLPYAVLEPGSSAFALRAFPDQ